LTSRSEITRPLIVAVAALVLIAIDSVRPA
jgi:hypothetical protein